VPKQRHWRYRLVIAMYRLVRWSQRRLPPGVRTLVGSLLMVGGVLGFLPILGFWMFPLGVAVAIADLPPLRRRMEHWLNETRRRYHVDMINGLRAKAETRG
jgi:predicted PurR-regulated permease PerM